MLNDYNHYDHLFLVLFHQNLLNRTRYLPFKASERLLYFQRKS